MPRLAAVVMTDKHGQGPRATGALVANAATAAGRPCLRDCGDLAWRRSNGPTRHVTTEQQQYLS